MPLKTRRGAGGWQTLGTALGPVGPVGPAGPPGPGNYPLVPFTPITPGIWTWFNQGAATRREQAGAIAVRWTSQSGGHLRGMLKPIGTNVAAVTIAWISANGQGNGNTGDGFVIAEADSGKYVSLAFEGQGMQPFLLKWTNPTTGATAQAWAGGNPGGMSGVFWARARFTATAYAIDLGYDGIWFDQVFTEPLTTFFSVRPDRAGFCGWAYHGGTHAPETTFVSYQET